jgi:hypothetical protein
MANCIGDKLGRSFDSELLGIDHQVPQVGIKPICIVEPLQVKGEQG